MNNSQEIRTDITQRIAKAMANSCPPWRRPWDTSKNTGYPCNFVTGKKYKGVNPLLLMMAAANHRFLSKFWGTQAQWEAIGAVVQSSPKFDPHWGTIIIFSKSVERDREGPIAGAKDRFFFLKYYTVYNVEQVAPPTMDAILNSHPARQRALARKTLGESVKKLTHQQAEAIRGVIGQRLAEMKVGIALPGDLRPARKFVKAVPARVSHGGDRAVYWHLPVDRIDMPPPDSFDTPSDYYEVLYHEFCHWGEADHRVGQNKGYKSHYAFSELVAEIGACFLAADTSLPLAPKMLPRSMSYIRSWLSEMNDDPRYVFEAARHAGKIVDYLLAFTSHEGVDQNQTTPTLAGA